MMNHPSRLALCVAAIVTPALFAAGCSSSHSKPNEYRHAAVIQEQTQPAKPTATASVSQPDQESDLIASLTVTDTSPETPMQPAAITPPDASAPANEPDNSDTLDEALVAALDDINTIHDIANDSTAERPALTLFRFGFDTVELSTKDREIIRQHAQFLAQHADKKIQLHGHADAQGDPAYNRHLATLRARHVAELLKQEGVSEAQIEIFSWGSDKPLASTNQWRDNRRVELFYEESLMVNATSEQPAETRL